MVLIGTCTGAAPLVSCREVCPLTLPAGDPWVRLPPVTPQQIIVSQKITRFFTGNLEAPVSLKLACHLTVQVVTSPAFPGVEKNLLRAQIARIAAATYVSPKGYYALEADDGEEGS